MSATRTEPIPVDWTLDDWSRAEHDVAGYPGPTNVTAADVTALLAAFEIAELDRSLGPALAAAAAELAAAAGITWRRVDPCPPVVLVRLIAKAAVRRPQAGGPDTERLHDLLCRLPGVATAVRA